MADLRRTITRVVSWRSLMFLGLLLVLFLAGCTLPDGTPAPVAPAIFQVSESPDLRTGEPGINSTITPEASQPLQGDPAPTEDLTPLTPLVIEATDCGYGGAFKKIEALDRYTVRFELCAPDATFLTKIAFPTFGIQPGEWFDLGEDGSENLFREGVIGTGPYRVSEWLPGEQLTLQAFEAYWQGPQPGTTTLIFRWNFDEVQRLMDLQAGVADGVDNISSFDFDTVQSDPNLVLIPRPPLSTAYIGMNNTASPFDDERVRQAIAMGINRNELVEMNFPGGFQVAQYFTPCVIPNGCEGDAWYAFDPLRAQALMEEAGYPDGFRTVLTYRDVARGYLPRPGVVAEAIKDQLWENLGIYAQLEVIDSEAFLQAVDNGELSGLYLLGWGADYPDVSNFLDTHFGKQASQQFGDKYVDLVELLREASAIYGDEARKPYYKIANNMIRLHVPAIPLAHGDWYAQGSLAAAYRNSVVGAHASPFGFESFAAMSADGQDIFLWEQSAEPLSLYCADETDSDSLRACLQILEPLYRYQAGGVVPEPALAESCTPEADLMAWVCKLRESEQFHDGSWLDANDVVTSFWVQWDAAHPFRQRNTFSFDYFHDYWGKFLNATSQ